MEDYKSLQKLPSGADVFSPSHFLGDIQNVCKAIDAPYCLLTTRACIEAFSRSFHEGAVLWRATSQPKKGVNYRFYERQSIDTISIATKAGLLKPHHPLLPLLEAWSEPFDGHIPEQSCDFDSKEGLTKTWVYMDGFRSLQSVLYTKEVPESTRQLFSRFQELGLDLVRHVAIDWHSNTVNLYFRVTGAITNMRITNLTNLAGYPPQCRAEYIELQKYLSPSGFTFGVTIAPNRGKIRRVAFYALDLAHTVPPTLDERLTKFFNDAPSYDKEEFTAVAWSFGEGEGKYIKGEKSYCGKLVPLLRGWKSNLKSDSDTDDIVPLNLE